MKTFLKRAAWLWCGLLMAHTSRAATPSTNALDHGPFFSATIRSPFPGKNTAMKGVAVKLGPDERAYVCYDTDLMRVSVAWTGDFLKFGNYLKEISHPQPPEIAGAPAFGTRPGPGWWKTEDIEKHAKTSSSAEAKPDWRTNYDKLDPRPRQQGPLPAAWAKYHGLYRHGYTAIFSYSVGDDEVLESPGYETLGSLGFFTRAFSLGRTKTPLTLLVAAVPDGHTGAEWKHNAPEDGYGIVSGANDSLVVAVAGCPKGAKWSIHNGHLFLSLPRLPKAADFKVLITKVRKDESHPFGQDIPGIAPVVDLKKLVKGGAPLWAESITTKGTLATSGGDGPYVTDLITEPTPNPWSARTFFGGFDFFPDGRAAICTFHGDVWIVSGLDDKLDKLTWKRFASGMFQPLGLKIVDGQIYVTCRDALTRLLDLNKDGEADFYESFNHDTVVTDNYHEFCLDLQTDRAGNFYYAKGSPWSPDVKSPHQGTMLKVSKDGSKLDIFASGLRAPNGAGMGPNDELTVSDNQGHWMPASKLNLVRKGGFYGMMPAAQHEITMRRGGTNLSLNPSDPQARAALKIPASDGAAPIPTEYDQPICWLPMNMDNSSGGQAWVTSDKWGPLKHHMLFMSYGRGTLFHVMTEEVGGVTQAGMVRFPLKFQTGLMRGRCNPRDGQMYFCGLRGWQTDGAKEGGFYRVRYTGKPVHTPAELHAAKDGLKITFTGNLDVAAAEDTANYAIEQWNYNYSGNYGSPEISAIDPAKKSHDKVAIESASLLKDKKTVFLKIPDLRPVNQMKIKLSLKAADGTLINQEIYNTIHKLGPVAAAK